MQKYTYIWWIHTDAMNNGRTQCQRCRKTSLTIFTSHFIVRVRKGLLSVSWRPNITELFWPQSYGRQRCVFLVLQGCSTGGPGPTLLGNDFLYCILSASSLDPNSSGPKWPLWPDVAFPTTSSLQLSATQLALELNSTELYNRLMPTRSLKSNV